MVSIVKPILHRATQSSLFEDCLRLLEQINDRSHNLLRVLTYHRIDEPSRMENLHPGMVSATPAEFARQIKEVARNYHVVSMHTVMDAIERKTSLPARSVLLTFDDAYRDFSEHAWPIMKSYNLPVTLFVPTAFPDQPKRVFWWDRLYAAVANANRTAEVRFDDDRFSLRTEQDKKNSFKKVRNLIKTLPHEQAMQEVDRICEELNAPELENYVLGWDDLRQLASLGVTLAPHTQTHPLLNRIDEKNIIEQAMGSLNDLCREIGETLPIIAYPAGGVSDAASETLRRIGFKLAFTTRRGINDLNSADLLQLRRINVGQGTSLSIFRAQLVQEFRWLNRCWL